MRRRDAAIKRTPMGVVDVHLLCSTASSANRCHELWMETSANRMIERMKYLLRNGLRPSVCIRRAASPSGRWLMAMPVSGCRTNVVEWMKCDVLRRQSTRRGHWRTSCFGDRNRAGSSISGRRRPTSDAFYIMPKDQKFSISREQNVWCEKNLVAG